MNRLQRFAVGLLVLASACSESTDTPLEPAPEASGRAGAVHVSATSDAGPGSFRAAVEQANSDPSVSVISFGAGLGTITPRRPVTYTGPQALMLDGNGARLDGAELSAGESPLVTAGGSQLTIQRLSVTNAPGNGITIKVPETAAGVFKVVLHRVEIRRNGLHGILINDQAEYFENPESVSSEGSPASLLVEVSDSRFQRNGFARVDSDGLRVNEGGDGNLEFHVRGTNFNSNGADGLELDERGRGSARFTLRNTFLVDNGSFTSEDFDDGIDVDEGGPGDLVGRFNHVVASRNFEQGVDLNENGPGDLLVRMADVRAAQNNEEGVEFEEDDDVAGGGHIDAELERVSTLGNGRAGGDAGLKLREKGEGNLLARVVDAVSLDNRLVSGDDAVSGILIQEDEMGSLRSELVRTSARRNSGDGIQLEENEAGRLDGQVRRSAASDNGGAGVHLTQATPGSGTAILVDLSAPGNGEGPVVAEGVTTTGAP